MKDILALSKSALVVAGFTLIVLWILTRGPINHPDPAFDRALVECLDTGLDCDPVDTRP